MVNVLFFAINRECGVFRITSGDPGFAIEGLDVRTNPAGSLGTETANTISVSPAGIEGGGVSITGPLIELCSTEVIARRMGQGLLEMSEIEEETSKVLRELRGKSGVTVCEEWSR